MRGSLNKTGNLCSLSTRPSLRVSHLFVWSLQPHLREIFLCLAKQMCFLGKKRMNIRGNGIAARGLMVRIAFNERRHTEIVVSTIYLALNHRPSILSALLNSHSNFRKALLQRNSDKRCPGHHGRLNYCSKIVTVCHSHFLALAS